MSRAGSDHGQITGDVESDALRCREPETAMRTRVPPGAFRRVAGLQQPFPPALLLHELGPAPQDAREPVPADPGDGRWPRRSHLDLRRDRRSTRLTRASHRGASEKGLDILHVADNVVDIILLFAPSLITHKEQDDRNDE